MKTLSPFAKLPIYIRKAVTADVAFTHELVGSLRQHQKSHALIHGALPFLSMVIVESYDLFKKSNVRVEQLLGADAIATVRLSRHRVKLLDNKERSIEEVASKFEAIISHHQAYYLALVQKTRIGQFHQSDVEDTGLFFYNGHLFSTSHIASYNLDAVTVEDAFERSASGNWFDPGQYIGKLGDHLISRKKLARLFPPALPGDVRDMNGKSDMVYSRGLVGNFGSHAASLITVLAQVNFVHYALRDLSTTNPESFFKFKFITAHHAFSSMRSLVALQYKDDTSPPDPSVQEFLKGVAAIEDAKWYKNKSAVRNYLVHYSLDQSTGHAVPDRPNHIQIIESLAKRPFDDLESMVDRQLQQLSYIMEESLGLKYA